MKERTMVIVTNTKTGFVHCTKKFNGPDSRPAADKFIKNWTRGGMRVEKRVYH